MLLNNNRIPWYRKKKKMGLGDVTNGIGAKVQKLGKICAHKEMVNCYKFLWILKIFLPVYKYLGYTFRYTCNRWWGSRNIDMGVIWGGSYTRMVKPIIGLQLETDISQKNSISM